MVDPRTHEYRTVRGLGLPEGLFSSFFSGLGPLKKKLAEFAGTTSTRTRLCLRRCREGGIFDRRSITTLIELVPFSNS